MDTILTIYFDVSYVILLQCITLVVSCDDHTLIEISKKIFKIYSWVSLGYFAVNLSGGQPKNVLMIMLYWIGKISRNCAYLLPNTCKVNAYSETLFPSDDCASIWSWLQWNYDVTWNPRIRCVSVTVDYSLKQCSQPGMIQIIQRSRGLVYILWCVLWTYLMFIQIASANTRDHLLWNKTPAEAFTPPADAFTPPADEK